MSTQKTNKSFTKRLKVTKKGKVIARRPGMNHYNAKESRSKQLNKKQSNDKSEIIDNKKRAQYMPHS